MVCVCKFSEIVKLADPPQEVCDALKIAGLQDRVVVRAFRKFLQHLDLATALLIQVFHVERRDQFVLRAREEKEGHLEGEDDVSCSRGFQRREEG